MVQAGKTQQTNTYDLAGRRTSTTSQDSGRIDYGYDPYGNLTSQQTPNQRATSTGYRTARTPTGSATGSAGDRLPRHHHPGHHLHLERHQHPQRHRERRPGNTAGQITRISDGAKTQDLGYDAYGNITTEKTTMNHPKWGLGAVETTFTHDWLGRLHTVGSPPPAPAATPRVPRP